MFRKVLIANRGEIALRIISACKEMGIRTVAIYSEADRNSLHVRFADEAICIGPPRSADSYLNVPAVISAAEIADVDAIHPGYGLLSENANFAEVCRASNIKFIGPPPEVTRLMGEKEKARMSMKRAKVPILPGSEGVIQSEEEALEWAKQIGYPVILKASAGGGGRGMRVVRGAEELPNFFRAARTEAQNAFGNGDLYMEKFIERPRHIEFQVLADEHGNVMSLGERECSIQRRHQKLIEESPSLQVTPKMREEIGATLKRCLETIGYMNAGTVEFLMDEDGKLYFIEMNADGWASHAQRGIKWLKPTRRMARPSNARSTVPADRKKTRRPAWAGDQDPACEASVCVVLAWTGRHGRGRHAWPRRHGRSRDAWTGADGPGPIRTAADATARWSQRRWSGPGIRGGTVRCRRSASRWRWLVLPPGQ